MKSVAPKKAKFLLCDDVRTESHGKLTIVGLYAGDKIIVHVRQKVPPEGRVALLPQFAIACFVHGGKGTFEPIATLISPSQKVIAEMQLGSITIESGQTSTIVMQGPNFAVPEFGKYVAKVALGAKAFTYDFEIVAAVEGDLG